MLHFLLPYPFSNNSRMAYLSIRPRQFSHKLLFRTFRTDYVRSIGDEATSYQGRCAQRTDETIVVPMAVFERDETCAADSWKEIGNYLRNSINYHLPGASTAKALFSFLLSNIYFLPVMGFSQAVQRFANSSPKQSAQYGLSSRLVNRCPASEVWQWLQVKHSRCHGSFL